MNKIKPEKIWTEENRKKIIQILILAALLILLPLAAEGQMKHMESRTLAPVFADHEYMAFYLEKDMLLEMEKQKEEESVPKEEEVYAFLQGPRSYERKQSGAGDWALEIINGNSFAGFGCGACCMANIYSTLSPYECSPLEMCYFAMEHTGYQPTRKVGAIGWGDLKYGLRAAGIDCELEYKTDTYEAFQEMMADAKSMVALVSSDEDDTFWKDTHGHYVNIWLYDDEDDTVFLAEPGDPNNNRSRIPLRYIYDALKTSSTYQFLAVAGYTEENDVWKHNGIGGTWYR